MRQLTLKQLEEAKPFEIMATGVVTEPELHFEPVRWVAVRGGAPDWCIYYHKADRSPQEVSQSGDKVTSGNLIENLVPCSKEALNKYRL